MYCLYFYLLFHYGQQTIYTENFCNQENKGVTGVNNGAPIEDLTGVSWTIDYSAATLSASTLLQSNPNMEARI